MNLLLIRHGEITSNIKKVYAGKSSEGLTEKGLHQAKKVAQELMRYKVNSIYSSPIKRAVQTAEVIGKELHMDFFIENAFREMELGPWEGLTEEEVAKQYSGEWQIWKSRPAELKLSGRETLSELQKRVLEGIQNIRRITDNRTVVIVTHVAIIRVLLLWHEKKSLNLYKIIHVPNTKVFEIEIHKRDFE